MGVHMFVYGCVFVFICIHMGLGEVEFRKDGAVAECRADYVWKSLHTCVSIAGVWSVRGRVNVRQAISGCFTKLRLNMASASVVPPSPPAYCDPHCLELGSGYDSAPSTWTPEEKCSIPSTDRAN